MKSGVTLPGCRTPSATAEWYVFDQSISWIICLCLILSKTLNDLSLSHTFLHSTRDSNPCTTTPHSISPYGIYPGVQVVKEVCASPFECEPVHPTPYTLHPTTYTLHPPPHPTPYTLHPIPYTSNVEQTTLTTKPDPKPQTLNPKPVPESLYPEPKPQALNP